MSKGRVLLGGSDITGMPAHAVARLGLARSFQVSSLFATLPVFENLRGYNKDGRPDGTLMAGVRLNAPLEPVDGGPGSSAQRQRAMAAVAPAP